MQNVLKGDAWSKSIRLAINVNDWTPTEAEWNKAINAIQVEPAYYGFSNDNNGLTNITLTHLLDTYLD